MNWAAHRITFRAVAGLATAAALVVPSTAGAATASVVDGTLVIAGGGESSNLTVTRSGGDLVVADTLLDVGVDSSDDGACAQTDSSPRRAVCDANGIDRVLAVLLDGADSVDAGAAGVALTFYGGPGDDTAVGSPFGDTLNGGDGADTLTGGAGVDWFQLGAGDDVVHARDAAAEPIVCGAGADRGSIDASDVVDGDCEPAVGALSSEPPHNDPQPPGQEPPAADPPGAADGDEFAEDDPPVDDQPASDEAPAAAEGDPAPVTIRTPSTVAFDSGGTVAVGVTCTAAVGDCAGSIQILEEGGVVKARATSPARRTDSGKKPVVLGRADFSIAAGEREQVAVRLSRSGRRRIIKKRKRRTRARIVITIRAPDGTQSTAIKTVTIAAPKERRTSGRGKPKPPARGGRRR